jgi:hypothetical protein
MGHHFVTDRGTCIKFLGLRQWVSQQGGEEGLRPQSQRGQDLSATAAAEQLIFKTSTEKQTVYLTNKDLTKDSERFSSWLHRPGEQRDRSVDMQLQVDT